MFFVLLAGIFSLKVNNRNTGVMCEFCSSLTLFWCLYCQLWTDFLRCCNGVCLIVNHLLHKKEKIKWKKVLFHSWLSQTKVNTFPSNFCVKRGFFIHRCFPVNFWLFFSYGNSADNAVTNTSKVCKFWL